MKSKVKQPVGKNLKWFKYSIADYDDENFLTVAAQAPSEKKAKAKVRKVYGRRYSIGSPDRVYKTEPRRCDETLSW